MSNPESGRFRNPDVFFRDPYVGYQEFKDLKNDLEKLKLTVHYQHKCIESILRSLEILGEI